MPTAQDTSRPTSEVRVAHTGPITEITIDRTYRRNALSEWVCRDITAAVEIAPDTSRVIIIRGAGSAFCAGADLTGSHTSTDFHHQLRGMLMSIQNTPVPVLADVQGAAVGAGMQLAMAADLRVVGEDGWFQLPPVKLGIAIDEWTIQHLETLVGGARARTMLLAATRMDQADAIACGLCSVPGGSATATELAENIAGYSPLSLRYHKQVLNRSLSHPHQYREAYARVWASEDAEEGARARAEGRPPRFTDTGR